MIQVVKIMRHRGYDVEEYISKVNDYRMKFLSLSDTGMLSLVANGEFESDEEREKIVNLLNGGELLRSMSINCNPVELTISPEDQKSLLTLSVVESHELLDKLRKTNIKQKKQDRYFISKLEYNKIRDANNEEKNPFNIWDRCIYAYKKYLEYKKTGKRRFQYLIAEDAKYKELNNKDDTEISRYKVRDDIRTAIIFIDRAVKNTFPYDENGKWLYRDDKFKKLKL